MDLMKKTLRVFLCTPGKKTGILTYTYDYSTKGWPDQQAAEGRMLTTLVLGPALQIGAGDGIRLCCNADEFEQNKPPLRAGLAGRFVFIGVDQHGRLANITEEQERLCKHWICTRDFRQEIIESYEKTEKYRGEIEREIQGFEDEE